MDFVRSFVEGLRNYWSNGGRVIAVSAVGGIVLLLALVYCGVAGVFALCWNAFILGTLSGPRLSFSGACGLLGLGCYIVAFVAVLKDWGE